MNVILLGAPGAGKGTQAKTLVRDFNLEHISTGDILREEVKKGSPVGLEAKKYMDKGMLVPDEVVIKLVAGTISGFSSNQGFLLDGFPRNENQAKMLEEKLSLVSQSIDRVIYLKVSKEVVISRLSGRRICKDCGAVYHVKNIPPQKEGICDKCNGVLYQREDDSEKTVLNRLEVYKKETGGLINYYKDKNLLSEVDGDLAQEETYGLMVKEIKNNCE
ncbi:MAG: adenylate kinase [Candidatus Auribacterota bacterium]|nr:adenylate kinase [Candidatus Auribacterota bacterium]